MIVTSVFTSADHFPPFRPTYVSQFICLLHFSGLSCWTCFPGLGPDPAFLREKTRERKPAGKGREPTEPADLPACSLEEALPAAEHLRLLNLLYLYDRWDRGRALALATGCPRASPGTPTHQPWAPTMHPTTNPTHQNQPRGEMGVEFAGIAKKNRLNHKLCSLHHPARNTQLPWSRHSMQGAAPPNAMCPPPRTGKLAGPLAPSCHQPVT